MKSSAFIADNANDAVRLVQQNLGPEAVIMSVRKLPANGFARLLNRPGQIEVTACVPDKPRHLVPQGVDKTLNVVEFYYPEEIAAFEPEFIEAERAAYMETAIEDDEIAERMDRGRLALYKEGRNEWGPYQSPMEDGMQHFHEFYRKTMGEHIES